MRSAQRVFALLLIAGAACTQVIGLDDFEEADGSAGRPSGGRAGEAGDPGESGRAGANGGSPSGGSPSGGSPDGGAPVGGSDDGGEGGSEPMGGAPNGGSAGMGGSGGDSGGAGPGGSCTTRSLLVDGSFENQEGDWIEYADDNVFILDDGSLSRQGIWVAWIGGLDDESPSGAGYHTSVSQLVVVPENTRQLRATCYMLIEEEEPGVAEEATDTVYMGIWDLDAEPPFRMTGDSLRFAQRSNLDASATYRAVTGTAAAEAIAGNAAWFTIWGIADGMQTTNFFVDSCSLVATVCE